MNKIKEFLKSILPPPVKSFMREINEIKYLLKQVLASLATAKVEREVLSIEMDRQKKQLDQLEKKVIDDAENKNQQFTELGDIISGFARYEEYLHGIETRIDNATNDIITNCDNGAIKLFERFMKLENAQQTWYVQAVSAIETSNNNVINSTNEKINEAGERIYENYNAIFNEIEKTKALISEEKKNPFEIEPKLPVETKCRREDADPRDAVVPDGFQKVIPIVFATNDKYAPYVGVAIESILQNASPDNYYRIYVLYTKLSRYHAETLDAIKAMNATVSCIDISKKVESEKEKMYTRAYFSEECYYRFFIPAIFNFFRYAIYLDSDVILKTDIARIIPTNMDVNVIAGVRNPTVSETLIEQREVKLGIEVEKYINTGVLVFNINQWIDENITEKCFKLLSDIPHKDLLCPDQDILNVVCKDRICFLEPEWNFFWHLLYGDEKQVKKIEPYMREIADNVNILHFSSRLKPWEIPQISLSTDFWKCARKSCFYEEIFTKFIAHKN